MRTIITLAILLLVTTTAQAMDPAPEIEWERLYPGHNFYDIRERTDGSYICAGWELASGNNECVFCYDKDGNSLWDYSDPVHPKIYSSTSLLQLNNNNILAIGSGLVNEQSTNVGLALSMLSEDGNNIWTKIYAFSDQKAYGYDATQLPDGGFAICGEISPAEGMNQAWILRTDSQGDTLWTREWGWQYNDKAMSILYIDNGLTVLMHGNTPTTPGGPHLVRYDLDGNMLWETDIPVLAGKYGQDMCEATDGGLLILTNMYPVLAHTDYYGNVDWYSNPHWDRLIITYGWSIDTTMDGGILYGGENRWQPGNTTIEQSGMINRMDHEGSFLWRDFIYNSNCSVIYSVRQLSQGGYIAAGVGSGSGGGQGLLIRYAPELGIASGDLTPAVKITSVSPNPFSSSLRITCSLPSPMSASLTVYGLDGRIVDVVEAGSFPAGEHTVSWIPSSELASGCYLTRLQTDVGIDARSFVYLE